MTDDEASLPTLVHDITRPSTNDTISPQVCDRCRIKKIGCDGVRPQCGNCTTAKAECTVSVRLRRKTKPRGYVEPKDQMLNQLKIDNQVLRTQLDAANKSSQIPVLPLPDPVRTDLPESQVLQQRPPWQSPPTGHLDSPKAASNQNFEAQPASTGRVPAPVIKHLGRLVSTEFGVERFAGTTTGVHFVHCTEQKYKEMFNTADTFPECVFRLQMLPQPRSLFRLPTPQIDRVSEKYGLVMDFSYYSHKVSRFLRRWGSIYPVLAQRQLFDSLRRIMEHLETSSQQILDADISYLHQIHLVLAIDAWDDIDDGSDPLPHDATYYFDLARQTEPQVIEKGDFSCLQSMLLTTIYFQLSGQHNLLAQMSGAAVRLAQSLGLHRHTRRFKFCAGGSEMRNRVWWCVYILDVISSISHGLPKIINDEDVDTELPLDCDLDDSTLNELPLSLPGEPTRFSNFLSYLRLIRIISNTTKSLYTTTHRRGAVEKIRALDRELRVWEHSFNNPFTGNVSRPYDLRESGIGGQSSGQALFEDDQSFFIPYLQFMSNVAMLMVHQPALTFGAQFPQFEKSMSACVQSCMQIINILDTHRKERRIFYLQPNTTRLIFQATLTCLYFVWHSPGSVLAAAGPDHGATIHVPLQSIVDTAVSLLEMQRSELLVTSSNDSVRQNPCPSEVLAITINLLRRLASQTLHRSQPLEYQEFDLPPVSLNNASVVPQQSPYENSGGDDIWGPSALEELNQLDMLEWSADYTSESFGFMSN